MMDALNASKMFEQKWLSRLEVDMVSFINAHYVQLADGLSKIIRQRAYRRNWWKLSKKAKGRMKKCCMMQQLVMTIRSAVRRAENV